MAQTLDEKRKAALEYLGTRHVLHREFDGGVSHDPQAVDVAKTVKRYNKRVAEAQKVETKIAMEKILKVRTIGGGK